MEILEQYEQRYRNQIVMGRKTPQQIVEYILSSYSATVEPVTTVSPTVYQNFINTISNSYIAKKPGYSPENITVQLLKINDTRFKEYIKRLSDWIYVMVEMQTGEMESNCWDLVLKLYVYRGISESDLKARGIEYQVYINYLKLLNEY